MVSPGLLSMTARRYEQQHGLLLAVGRPLDLLASSTRRSAGGTPGESCQQGKDEAFATSPIFVEAFPIPRPTDEQTVQTRGIRPAADRRRDHAINARQDLLTGSRSSTRIAKPSTKLENPIDLDSDAFIAEVKKLRGKKKPLSLAGLRSLREEHGAPSSPPRSSPARPSAWSSRSATS